MPWNAFAPAAPTAALHTSINSNASADPCAQNAQAENQRQRLHAKAAHKIKASLTRSLFLYFT